MRREENNNLTWERLTCLHSTHLLGVFTFIISSMCDFSVSSCEAIMKNVEGSGDVIAEIEIYERESFTFVFREID